MENYKISHNVSDHKFDDSEWELIVEQCKIQNHISENNAMNELEIITSQLYNLFNKIMYITTETKNSIHQLWKLQVN
jgi:hypothetical protein